MVIPGLGVHHRRSMDSSVAAYSRGGAAGAVGADGGGVPPAAAAAAAAPAALPSLADTDTAAASADEVIAVLAGRNFGKTSAAEKKRLLKLVVAKKQEVIANPPSASRALARPPTGLQTITFAIQKPPMQQLPPPRLVLLQEEVSVRPLPQLLILRELSAFWRATRIAAIKTTMMSSMSLKRRSRRRPLDCFLTMGSSLGRWRSSLHLAAVLVEVLHSALPPILLPAARIRMILVLLVLAGVLVALLG